MLGYGTGHANTQPRWECAARLPTVRELCVKYVFNVRHCEHITKSLSYHSFLVRHGASAHDFSKKTNHGDYKKKEG